MPLEVRVDPDLASLAGLYLPDGEDPVGGEELSPGQKPEVGDAQTEEAAASDEEAHDIVAVTVETVDPGEHSVPFDGVRGGVGILDAHFYPE